MSTITLAGRRLSADRLEYYRDLIYEAVRAELAARHFGKLLGPLWWLLEPVLMAGLYFFITTVMFSFSGGAHFLMLILTSVIAYRWFSKTVDSSPLLVTSYQGVLKQTNFPVTVLLLVNVATELMFFLFGLAVLLVAAWIAGFPPSPALVALPLIMLVEGLLILGLSSFLALAGAYLRDLAQVVWLGTSVLFYLSPGIYPIERVPEGLRPFYALNPFATLLPAYASVILDGRLPPLLPLLIWLVIGVAVSFVGVIAFTRSRRRFFKLL